MAFPAPAAGRKFRAVGLIEVMKQFTEVHADAGGKIVRFLVDNEAPIEPGQPVLLIEIA